MTFPIKICVVCSEEFELKPGKPGFANRCPECSVAEDESPATPRDLLDNLDRKEQSAANAERRKAMRDLLYRKDS